jgi:nucleotide-binding universal stress UspA family protein
MSLLTRRRGISGQDASVHSSGDRPVLLATLDVPFSEDAIAFAVDSAVESGHPLLVVNVAEILLTPSTMVGYGYVERDDLQDALRKPVDLAGALAVPIERMRVCSPHPVDALLEVVAERNPALLVFGPDRASMPRRQFRRAERTVRARASCLVWVSDL